MKKFKRKDGYIGGVCEGLGDWSGIDAIVWRIGFILTGWFFVYLILWAFSSKEY
jgi:phage shock protein PspC (stress-responsive transcriptional regulator)